MRGQPNAVALDESKSTITESSVIVIEFPKYVEIEYGTGGADDDEIDVNEILERTEGYLTVFSASVKPVHETGRDKLILNASSTSSLPLGS